MDSAHDLSPTARAERGQDLRLHSAELWPAVYDNTDRAHDALTLVHDAVHANLVGVSLAELPERLGALLGQVAADAMIDRSTEAGEITEPWEIERLIAQLADAVRVRHYG